MHRPRDRAPLHAALRFAIAMAVINPLALLIFGTRPAATFASFAVSAMLLFLDFDGSRNEQLVGFGIATLVSTLGVVAGTLLAPNLVLAVAGAGAMAFVFGFSRVFRGYVARSTVGAQLAFFLAVVLPGQPSHLGSYVAGWLLGCVLAATFAVLLWPRRHSGQVRRACARWLNAAADLTDAIGRGADLGAARAELAAAEAALVRTAPGSEPAIGLASRRSRSLDELVDEARTLTSLLAETDDADLRDPYSTPLAHVTATAYRRAAAIVVGGSHYSADCVAVRAARRADLESVENAVAGAGRSADRLVEATIGHYATRVLAFGAETAVRLAGLSQGETDEGDTLGTVIRYRPVELLRANLTWRSIWLRNGLRTALVAAISVFVVRELDIHHGFWVAMAALSLLQGSFSEQGGRSVAIRTSIGAVVGVGVASMLIAVHLPILMLYLLLPVSAFAARWFFTHRPDLAQGTYTVFAVINVSLLDWPPTIRTGAVRIEDVALGAAVALAATLVVFPHGLTRFLGSVTDGVRSNVQDLLRDGVRFLAEPAPNESAQQLAAARIESGRAVERLSDALDSTVRDPDAPNVSEAVGAAEQTEAWARACLVFTDVALELTELGLRPGDEPRLGELLSHPAQSDAGRSDGRRTALESLLRDQPDLAAEQPRAFLATAWSMLWLDSLATLRSDPIQPVR